MKETYEKISIEITVLKKEDVITTSSPFDDTVTAHVNSFIDFNSFF